MNHPYRHGLIAAVISQCIATSAFAVSEWDSNTTYATAGTIVSYQGQLYSNGWWTRGDNPSQSGAWGVWKKVAANATPTASSIPTNTPVSTAKPTATPSAVPTTAPTAAPAGCSAANWDSNIAYTTGQKVSYLGRTYQTQWWSRGEIPANNTGSGKPWIDLGACGGSVATPTAAPTATPQTTAKPTSAPTVAPSIAPTVAPTLTPKPTVTPTVAPTPTATPSATPSTGSIIPARSWTLEQPGDIGTLRAAQLRSFNHTPFQSTGYWVQPGDTLVVNYVYNGVAPNKAPEIWLHSTDDDTWNYDSDQKTKLVVGSNTIVSKVKGAVYVAAFNTPNSGELKVDLVSGGRVMPRFVLGEHNLANWQTMLASYSDAPYAELVSKRMMLTTSLAKAQRFVDDPTALMTTWDEIVRLEDEQYGIKPGNSYPHNPTPHRFHFVELAPYDGWMYSWQYRMASASDDGAIGTVLNSKLLKTDGWGPWHELGHQYQMSTFTWTDQTEVTVNLSSAYVQRGLGQPSRFETQGTWTKTFAYLNQASRDFATQSDLFVRATMFWQLDLAFGRDFYAKLGTNYRNMPAAQRPSGDDAEKQTFVIETSRVAGYNLTPFFTQWGIPVTSATQITLSSMGLKTLTDPIWLNRDNKISYQPR